MKDVGISLTLLLAQALSAASLTAYLEVSFIGDSASLVRGGQGDVELLQNAFMQAYNCDDDKAKYGRYINSATVSLDSLVNGDQTHFSWIMEIEGAAASCKDQGFFRDNRRQLDNIDQNSNDNNDQKAAAPSLRGREGSSSSIRELKGRKCHCLSLEAVTVLYKQKIAELIQIRSILDVTSMQLVDPIDCGPFETFESYVNVEYLGNAEGLTDAENALMATGFVDTFNNNEGEVCDPNFRSLTKADIIGVQRVVERRLEPEEEEQNLQVTATSLAPSPAPVSMRRPSVAYLLIRSSGACMRCVTQFRSFLFDYVSDRMLEEWMLPVHSEQHIRNLQGFCFCGQDAVNRGQSTSEFSGRLNRFVQTNDFPSIDEVLGVEETEEPSQPPSMAPTSCVDGVDNTSREGCRVPISLEFTPELLTLARESEVSFDACNTGVELESYENRFYNFEAPEDMIISIDTCQDVNSPRFIQIYEGAGYGGCIGLSKQGACGTGAGTKIQMSLQQGRTYTIEVFEALGECHSSSDVSQAVFPFKGATVDTFGQRPILPYGCPSLVSVGTGSGDFWRFVATDTKVTLCEFEDRGDATEDSFFVVSGSCHSSTCVGSGTCSGNRGLTFNTVIGEPYWIIYNTQDRAPGN